MVDSYTVYFDVLVSYMLASYRLLCSGFTLIVTLLFRAEASFSTLL